MVAVNAQGRLGCMWLPWLHVVALAACDRIGCLELPWLHVVALAASRCIGYMWLHSLHVIALPGVQVVSLAACGCLCCVYWLDVVFENACDHLIRTTSFGLCNGHPGRLTIKHKNQQVPC